MEIAGHLTEEMHRHYTPVGSRRSGALRMRRSRAPKPGPDRDPGFTGDPRGF
jgi:hypothetical protein